MSDVVSKAEFAQLAGVSKARVSQWLRDGVIGPEALLGQGRHARIRAELALEMLRTRLELSRSPGAAKSELVTARTRTANLQAELLSLRLSRASGATIPRDEALVAVEDLGRSIRRALAAIPGCWAEELVAAEQDGGLRAVSALLRVKSAELLSSIADMIAAAEAELIDDPPDRGQ